MLRASLQLLPKQYDISADTILALADMPGQLDAVMARFRDWVLAMRDATTQEQISVAWRAYATTLPAALLNGQQQDSNELHKACMGAVGDANLLQAMGGPLFTFTCTTHVQCPVGGCPFNVEGGLAHGEGGFHLGNANPVNAVVSWLPVLPPTPRHGRIPAHDLVSLFAFSGNGVWCPAAPWAGDARVGGHQGAVAQRVCVDWPQCLYICLNRLYQGFNKTPVIIPLTLGANALPHNSPRMELFAVIVHKMAGHSNRNVVCGH